MKKNGKRKGIWIPEELMSNSELDWSNKVLLAEIQSLHNTPRGCFASNEHFADLLGLKDASSASKRISDLKEMGYVTTKNVYGKCNIVGRVITPTFKKAPTETIKVDSGSSQGNSKKDQEIVPERQRASSQVTKEVVPGTPGGSSQTTRVVVLERYGGSSCENTINTIIKTNELKQEINTEKLIKATRTQNTRQENLLAFTLSELKVLDGIIPERTLEEYRVLLDPMFIEEKNWNNDLLEIGIYPFLKITKDCHHYDEANILIIKCYYKLALEKKLRESRI